MRRHEAVVSAGAERHITIACACGWTEDLGRSPSIVDCVGAFGRHQAGLCGPRRYGAHLVFGWDEGEGAGSG